MAFDSEPVKNRTSRVDGYGMLAKKLYLFKKLTVMGLVCSSLIGVCAIAIHKYLYANEFKGVRELEKLPTPAQLRSKR